MQEDLRELLTETAKALTGRNCLVFFSPPPTKGAIGECYREGESLVIIDILPGQSMKRIFDVFLHESAHALNDFAIAPVHKIGGAIPQSIKVDWAKYQPETSPIEKRTENQAQVWLDWVNRYAAKYIEPGDSEEEQIRIKLVCLKFYKALKG